MNRDWVNELGHQTSKTPTCLLLKPDLSFDSFGYEAEERYAYLRSVYEGQAEFLFFQHFKIALYKDKILDLESTLEASNGKTVRAITVFAHCIRSLRHEAVQIIRQETGEEGCDVNDIQRKTKDTPSQAGAETLDEANAKFILVDIGGGSLDMTAMSDMMMVQLMRSTRRLVVHYGALRVSRRFQHLLAGVFGAQKLYDYRKMFPSDWLNIMEAFETKKRTFKMRRTMIRLPGSFVSSMNDFRNPSMKSYGAGSQNTRR
ncbi:hypothetical protein OS493_034748 [Desmophyllum pertusum]|uniref:Uncharacterized protein n=1 Tax=Desmophyllum pertusum TaxID=174260 RepID=A0A9X0CNX5_9CNID|nr:hypothetical protein OS493_034748 [Desmophyllum pertusum]